MQKSGLYGAVIGLVVLLVLMAIVAESHLELLAVALRIMSLG